jgi:ParB family transcriptional regulator, chromosome partitioning protein
MEKNKRKMGLGRGLDSIFSSAGLNSDAEDEKVLENDHSLEIKLDQIETNPFQPRTNFDKVALEDLKTSIINQGIIQPIAVRKIANNRYQIISGERRFQASKLAGLKSIPAYIKVATDIQMLEMGIIENIQRENLNPIEIARSYKRLLEECNIKQEELGNRIGKDRTTVNNYLRLLNLPSEVLNGLEERKLSMGQARALLGLNNADKIQKAFNLIITEDLSVRKVEDLVKKLNNSPAKTAKSTPSEKPKKHSLYEYEAKVKPLFKTPVLIQADEKQKGEIKIQYSSKEELSEILLKLKREN